MRKYKKWSREEVIRTIKEFRQRGIPLNFGYVAKKTYSLVYAARKYIGDWKDAIKAAGLSYDKIRRKNIWNKKKVLVAIRKLARNKEPLNISYVGKYYGGLLGAAVGNFGSWKNAINAAGFDYSKIKKQKEWSKEEIVKEIRRLHKKGVNLSTTREVRRIFRTLHAAAVRYFRSWKDAVAASGIKIGEEEK